MTILQMTELLQQDQVKLKLLFAYGFIAFTFFRYLYEASLHSIAIKSVSLKLTQEQNCFQKKLHASAIANDTMVLIFSFLAAPGSSIAAKLFFVVFAFFFGRAVIFRVILNNQLNLERDYIGATAVYDKLIRKIFNNFKSRSQKTSMMIHDIMIFVICLACMIAYVFVV